MPRLLPPEWIKLIARNHLLLLYEKEHQFVHEWHDIKRPFTPLIEQMGIVSALIDAEELSALLAPSDLFASFLYLQKIRDYTNSLPGIIDLNLNELQESYSSLQDRLAPYVLRLNELAYRWNLRASWAGEELMCEDVDEIKKEIFDAAGASALRKLPDLQIQRLFDQEEGLLPSDIWPINIVSLYLAGGRRGFVKQFNEKLIEFEKRLKDSGIKEPPSALRRHARWWFDHYVHNVKFYDIANEIAQTDRKGGPQIENVRKAVIKFSKTTDIEPIERT
jgi:hypothetical protein